MRIEAKRRFASAIRRPQLSRWSKKLAVPFVRAWEFLRDSDRGANRLRGLAVIPAVLFVTSCAGMERVQKSPLCPATLTIGTANHSETGKIVGAGVSLTWNLK